MGSKNGKYVVENEGSNGDGDLTMSTLPSSSSRSMVGEKSSKAEASLPRLIHHDASSSSSNVNNVTLVWLDRDLYRRPSNIDTEIKLKNIINYLRTFVDVDICEQYIEQIGQTDSIDEENLLLIVSPTLALTIIPHVHDLPHVKYVYVYGKTKRDAKINQSLLKKYTKVKGIFSTSRSLLAQIAQDQN